MCGDSVRRGQLVARRLSCMWSVASFEGLRGGKICCGMKCAHGFIGAKYLTSFFFFFFFPQPSHRTFARSVDSSQMHTHCFTTHFHIAEIFVFGSTHSCLPSSPHPLLLFLPLTWSSPTFGLPPSLQTPTEKRPLVPKASTTTSNQTASSAATKNGTASTAASKIATSARTTTSTRTATTTAAKKPAGMRTQVYLQPSIGYCSDDFFLSMALCSRYQPHILCVLASKTDSKPGEEKKPGALKTSAGRTLLLSHSFEMTSVHFVQDYDVYYYVCKLLYGQIILK